MFNSFYWLRALLILVATCAAIITVSASAYAEDAHHGRQHRHQCPAYADIDANGDNAVTAEEFHAFRAARMAARAEAGGKMKNAKHAPSFEDLDLDDDGTLSAEEFAEHQSQCPMRMKHKADGADEA